MRSKQKSVQRINLYLTTIGDKKLDQSKKMVLLKAYVIFTLYTIFMALKSNKSKH